MSSTAPAGGPDRSLHRTATTRANGAATGAMRAIWVAASINISHGGLPLDGKLPPAGQAQDRYCRQHPEERF